MSINPLKFLVSDAKRFKLGVLAKERLLFARQAFINLFSALSGVGSGQDANISPEPDSSWSYVSKLQLPEEVLNNTVVKGEQDAVLNDHALQTKFDYSVATFNSASFYSNGVTHVSLFDAQGLRVPKYSNTKFGATGPRSLRLSAVKHLSGTTLTLYGNVENTSGNIGHWMVDGVSRLFLALKCYSLDDIDHVIVPKLKYGFQRASLVKLGIRPEKIVELDVLQCVKCETLIATTKPRGQGSSVVPGWLIDNYREVFIPEPLSVSDGKRIYISRRDAPKRKIVNEDEVVNFLEQYGFQAVEVSSYNFDEKIKLFSNAEVIVGLTGAGLTNLIFCHRNASVLELFPDTFVSYFYTSICSYLGLNYHSLKIKSDSVTSTLDKYHGDLYLDIEMLSVAMNELLSRQGEYSEQKPIPLEKMSDECS